MDVNTLTPDVLLQLNQSQLSELVQQCGQQINAIRDKIEQVPSLDEVLSPEWRSLSSLRKTLLARKEQLQPSLPTTRKSARYAA